ncbi:MAG TPA: hypothetical protein V6D33_14685 [Cyanophyceae cyanobacterium]
MNTTNIASVNHNGKEMAMPDNALIKQCLGSPLRMRTLQEQKKLTIYAKMSCFLKLINGSQKPLKARFVRDFAH